MSLSEGTLVRNMVEIIRKGVLLLGFDSNFLALKREVEQQNNTVNKMVTNSLRVPRVSDLKIFLVSCDSDTKMVNSRAAENFFARSSKCQKLWCLEQRSCAREV
ncbi:hypothetical protein CDAR_60851 [Caerostris darwini]|uniref:Uncharacterized protein n=1 Tax=Caerostris darwini TaxID=1538125 RepID=A0AAV4VI55_9ARAC|nr:hypothetical protein CDAR_60851 [Caerostris darwini]